MLGCLGRQRHGDAVTHLRSVCMRHEVLLIATRRMGGVFAVAMGVWHSWRGHAASRRVFKGTSSAMSVLASLHLPRVVQMDLQDGG